MRKKLTPAIRAARKKPGGSNAGKYPNVKKSDFAGPAGGAPAGTFPVPTEKKGKSAIKLAHNAPKPSGIKKFVCKKYPGIESCSKAKSKSRGKK